MILLAIAIQAVAPPPPAPAEEDIVVIARKLDTWRGAISTTPLRTRCVTKKSTGDAEIDRIGCTAMERCWPKALSHMKAARAKGMAKEERARIDAAVSVDFGACVKPQRTALIEELRARRAAARTAGDGS